MTAPRIVSDDPCEPGEWDRAWEASPTASHFESRQWAEVWSRSTSGRMRPAGRRVTFDDGLVVIVPGSDDVRAGGLMRLRRMSAADTYGGWLAANEIETSHAGALVRAISAKGSVRWVVNPFLARLADPSVLPRQGTSTSALDLADGYDVCRAHWSKGHRSAARQAERQGVEISQAATDLDWGEYYRVYESSLARWGNRASSRYPWQLFRELAAEPMHVRLWIASLDGAVVAGALCLYAPQIVSYWHGAADERYFSHRPTNLLLQEAIRHAAAAGYRWFDLGPSGGHEGVERFKHGFAPTRLEVPVLDRSAMHVAALRSFRRVGRTARRHRTAVE